MLFSIFFNEAVPIWLMVLYIIGMLLFVVMEILNVYALLLTLQNRVIISPMGVAYRKQKKEYTLAWEDVDKIFVMPNRYGIYNKSATICFLRKGSDESVITADMKKFGANFFGIQYRKRVVTVIRNYWDGRIWDIEKV